MSRVIETGYHSRAVTDYTDGMIVVDAKKLLMFAGIALVIFYVVSQPENSAGMVGTIVDFLRDSAESVITFVRGVFA